MYFPNTLKEAIWVDLNFTENLNFSIFPKETFQSFSFDDPSFTIDMFTVTYEITSDKSYRVILTPNGFTFIYNMTVTVTTIDMPNPELEAENGRPLRPDSYQATDQVVWFLIVAPEASDL